MKKSQTTRIGFLAAALATAVLVGGSPIALASHAGQGDFNFVAPKGSFHNPTALATTYTLKYYGGKVIPNVKVYQVLYGTGTYIPEVSGTNMGSFYTQGTNT